MFSGAYCDMLLDEVEHYADSGLPVRRPNSMNNYGLIVNEIGLEGAPLRWQMKTNTADSVQ
jgi:hypothetical protein